MQPTGKPVVLGPFTHIDKRPMRGRPLDALEEAYNCIIDRANLLRRRWSLDFRVFHNESASGPPTVTATERISNPVGGTFDKRPLYQWGFFYSGDKLFAVDATYPVPLNVLVCMGVKIRLFNVDGVAGLTLATELGSTGGAIASGYYIEARTCGWDMYNHGPAAFELIDTSTPDDQGGYQALYICNGRGCIQIWDGATTMTPVALTGADPLTLEYIQRSDWVLRFNDTLLYHSVEFENILFYSRPLSSGGLQDFDEAGDAYWVHFNSGVDNPIRSGVKFGDQVYVFTPRSTWRLSYKSFAVEAIMNVGCPSRRGVAIVGSIGQGAQQMSGPGNLIFITYDRTIVVSDGISSTDVSTAVSPVLDELHDYQRDNCIVFAVRPLGTVLVCWPGVDLASTDGLVFDTLTGMWVGECHWDMPIDSIGIILDEVHVGARDIGALAYNNDGLLDGNHHLAGVVKLQGEHPIDLAYRHYRTAAPNYTYHITDGRPVAWRMRTPDHDFGSPVSLKGASNVFFDLEPYGKWDVESALYLDGQPIPELKAIDGLDRQMESAEDHVYGETVPMPYRQSTPRGQINSHGRMIAVGMQQTPGHTTDTDTVMWGGTTQQVANPGGATIRAMQMHIDTAGPGMERVRTP